MNDGPNHSALSRYVFSPCLILNERDSQLVLSARGLAGLRPHDLRHHAITKLAESSEASEQTIMSIAGHVSREMLEHYSHIRQEAKRRAVESLDNDTITSQLEEWQRRGEQPEALQVARRKRKTMVGTGRFELPTPRTPSECSTRLSHVPTRKDSTDFDLRLDGERRSPAEGVNTAILH
jgi:Phage integrase family